MKMTKDSCKKMFRRWMKIGLWFICFAILVIDIIAFFYLGKHMREKDYIFYRIAYQNEDGKAIKTGLALKREQFPDGFQLPLIFRAIECFARDGEKGEEMIQELDRLLPLEKKKLEERMKYAKELDRIRIWEKIITPVSTPMQEDSLTKE